MSIFVESKSYRPFVYPWAVEAAKKHAIDMSWDVHQLELQDDLRQYNTAGGLATPTVSHLTNKYIIDTSLLVFTELDRTVACGYIELLQYVKNNEIKNLLLTFASREVVHQRAYAIAAETFGFSDAQWVAFQSYKAMRDKLDVMGERALTGRDEYKACVKLAVILLGEGIGLFAAFMYLLNQKRSGIMMGFNDVNQWSLNDEQDHVENNIKILFAAMEDLTVEEKSSLFAFIKELIARYVEAEHHFIDLLTEKGDAEDLTKEDAKEHIVFLGEYREYQLGLRDASTVRRNPVEWMEWMLSAGRHDNFFEKRVSEYTHGGLKGTIDYSKYRAILEAS